MISRIILGIKDPALLRRVSSALSMPGVILDSVTDSQRLWNHVSGESGDLVLVTRGFAPEPENLLPLLNLPEPPYVVVIFPEPDPEAEAAFLAAGCEATLSSDLPTASLRKAVTAILNKRSRALDEAVTTRGLAGADPRISDFVSKSPAMHTFMSVVTRVTPGDVSLLMLGETGVGKEHLARAIHSAGPRSNGPFIAVNCGALPESLLESELFGHEKGSFTGASRSRRGWFEMAHDGTVFLDEIGELQPHLQVKLLRVLQDRQIQRVGSERSIKINLRIMAATNRDLASEMESGRFRRDLFYRLSVVTLVIPPLRERTEDIPELVENYISHFYAQTGCTATAIEETALAALMAYDWPGNVRELMNVIERAMILCEGDRISLCDLPENVAAHIDPALGRGFASALAGLGALPQNMLDQPLRIAKKMALDGFERSYLDGLLQAHNGRIAKTAAAAGIQPRSLYDKMKAHGLHKEDYRAG